MTDTAEKAHRETLDSFWRWVALQNPGAEQTYGEFPSMADAMFSKGAHALTVARQMRPFTSRSKAQYARLWRDYRNIYGRDRVEAALLSQIFELFEQLDEIDEEAREDYKGGYR